MKCICKRCGREWKSRLKEEAKPVMCPTCHATGWETVARGGVDRSIIAQSVEEPVEDQKPKQCPACHSPKWDTIAYGGIDKSIAVSPGKPRPPGAEKAENTSAVA
jgi:hypothetical protein